MQAKTASLLNQMLFSGKTNCQTRGVDLSADYLSIGARRFGEVETAEFRDKAFHLIADLRNMPPQSVGEEIETYYGETSFFE